METLSTFNQLKDLPARFHHAVTSNAQWNVDGFFMTDINRDDEKDYRRWAREHFNIDMELKPIWHPIVIDECCKIIKEFNKE